MVNYLLLRDNKETGPFSLEELLKMGLKPYDLVWIPGKSAAWRYPSEIDELKAYAPEVEEQPFDRFFKKPATVKADPDPQPEIPAAHQAYAPKVAVAEQQKYVAKKSVFVTLPGQLAEKKTTPAIKPAPVPKPAPTPIPDYTATDINETISITENPVAKIKYSQPLDEIKEMYVKTLRERKDRIARKSFLKVSLKRAAIVGGLIGVGVLAGYILQPKPAANSHIAQVLPSSTANTAQTETTPPAELEPVTPSVPGPSTTAIPSETEPPLQQKQEPRQKQPASSPALSAAADNNNDEPSAKNAKAIMPAPQLKDEPSVEQNYIATETNPVTGERTRAVRSEQKENTEEKTLPITTGRSSSPTSQERVLAGLGNQVTVSSNDYKRVALGGIRNLELTVINRSKYNLDQVMVELQYIKPNDQPVKTEMIQFKSISANESATVRVPDTNRGVRVQFKIVRIGSRQANESGIAQMSH